MSDARCRVLEIGQTSANISQQASDFYANFANKVLDAKILTQGTENYGTRQFNARRTNRHESQSGHPRLDRTIPKKQNPRGKTGNGGRGIRKILEVSQTRDHARRRGRSDAGL